MAWENSSVAAVAVAAAVAHLGFDRIGFDRIAHFQKMLFFAPQMNQEMIKVPCFQKNLVFLPKK